MTTENGGGRFYMLKLHLKVLVGFWVFTALLLIGSMLVFWSLEPLRFMIPVLVAGHLLGMLAFEIFCRFIQTDHTIYKLYGQMASVREFGEWSGPKGRDYYVDPDRRSGTSRRAQGYVQDFAHGGAGLESHKSGLDPHRAGAMIRHSRSLRASCDTTALMESIARGVQIGLGTCTQQRSIVAISGMAFGTITRQAVQAISIGASRARVLVNTGEGSIASHHVVGDDAHVELQFGTGYFGCRTLDGAFDLESLVQRVRDFPEIKSIQIKLSQGAKAGHGGHVPGEKVDAEIAEIRGIPVGQDCKSSGIHSAFSGPGGLVEFIHTVRQATGLPVVIKMAIGSVGEFEDLCRAMRDFPQGAPDAIQVDGGEGGTGAAYMEVFGQAALPLLDALQIVDLLLRKFAFRRRVKIIASGQVFQADHVARAMALGADTTMTARGAKYALGCVAAGLCHKAGECPSGVANNGEALDVKLRARYLANYFNALLQRVALFVEPMGIDNIATLVGTRQQYMDINGVHIWTLGDVQAVIDREQENPIERLMAT